jgi:hypothetical protein
VGRILYVEFLILGGFLERELVCFWKSPDFYTKSYPEKGSDDISRVVINQSISCCTVVRSEM